MLPIRSRPWLKPDVNKCPFRIREHELLELMLLRESDIERIWACWKHVAISRRDFPGDGVRVGNIWPQH